jgi:hypothetical protein
VDLSNLSAALDDTSDLLGDFSDGTSDAPPNSNAPVYGTVPAGGNSTAAAVTVKSSNTMLYVGIGLVAVVALIVVLKK